MLYEGDALVNFEHYSLHFPHLMIFLYLSLLIQLVHLPDKKRGIFLDDDSGSIDSEFSGQGKSDMTNLDELVNDYRKNRRKGMLGWFKLKVSFSVDVYYIFILEI